MALHTLPKDLLRKTGSAGEKFDRFFQEQVLRRINLVGPIGTFEKRDGLQVPRREAPRLSVATAGQKLRTKTRLETQGFQTPHLAKAAKHTSSVRRAQSREKMRRLGRRLKGRIDF